MLRDDDHFYRFLSDRFRPINENKIFVIMPFAASFERRYKELIRVTLENEGYQVQRADEIYGTSELITNIIRSLQEARLVIADLTGRNPNVLYELGLANGFGKDVLLLASDESDIPTDLKHLTYFILNDNDPQQGAALLVKNVRNMIERSSEYMPVTQVQRILTYSHALGITDIVPATEIFAFQLMLTATRSIDIVLMSGRTLSGIHARNLATQLSEKFKAVKTRVVLVDPKSPYCDSYYDAIDGFGEGNCAAQIEVGYRRLKALGVEPRFHKELVPWGGTIVDGEKAAIQFVYPGEWQTYFLMLESAPGGLLNSLHAKFDQLFGEAKEGLQVRSRRKIKNLADQIQ